MIVCGVARATVRGGVIDAPGQRIADVVRGRGADARVVSFLPSPLADRVDRGRDAQGDDVVAYEPIHLTGYWTGEGASPADWDRYLAALGEAAAPEPSWIVLSGGLPRGVPLYTYQETIPSWHASGARMAVALKGEVLGATLVAKPTLTVIDRVDAASPLDGGALDETGAAAAAERFARTTHGTVIIVGDDLAVAVGSEGVSRSSVRCGSVEQVLANALIDEVMHGDLLRAFTRSAA